MKYFGIFLAALAGIALLGWIVSKVTGSHAYLLEDWKFNDGESVVWRDDAADVTLIPKLGQAVNMTPIRLHRWSVVVTNQRVIAANKAAFGGKHMVMQVLYPGAAPGGDSKKIDGGLLTTGYQTLVIEPSGMKAHLDSKPPYIELTPKDSEPSSTNLSEVRIYTESGATFRLP
ncbi:MAG TPA: hypothetical protein VMV18_09865 [bacterium]|nr:hypothetical protein [bacterium]